MEFFDDHFDGFFTPSEVGLAYEDLDLAFHGVFEGEWEGVHGGDFGVFVDAVEGVVGVEGPTADECPAGDVWVGGLDLLHFGGGLCCGFWREGVDHWGLDAFVFGGLFYDAVDAGLEVGGGGVAGEDGDFALAIHDGGELTHEFFSGFVVVYAVVGHASGIWGVGVEGDDDDAFVYGGFEGAGEEVCVGAGDGDAVDTGGDELFDILGLELGVFHCWGLPKDFDGGAVEFFGEAFASGEGAVFGGEEDGVGVAFGDDADFVGEVFLGVVCMIAVVVVAGVGGFVCISVARASE